MKLLLNKSMNAVLRDLTDRYLKITIAFLPIPGIVRLAEYFYLESNHALPSYSWKYELAGYLIDNLVFLSVALFLFVPFIFISFRFKKTAVTISIIAFLLFSILSYALSKYFTITLVPLDQVIYFYSFTEMVKISLSSTRFDPVGIFLLLLIITIPFILLYLMRNTRFPRISWIVFLIVLVVSASGGVVFNPVQDKFHSDLDYFMVANKPSYLVKRLIVFYHMKPDNLDSGVSASQTIKAFQRLDPGLMYIDNLHPLLRIDDTPDNLSKFFNFGKEKPNLVFIIVESLSPSFCGEKPYYGSFMPFLDSLIKKSLYWNNCLATSERTFNVLPAVLASLPYSDGIFLGNIEKMPYHYSLIRYLREYGYYSTFNYGGDPNFSGYNHFLIKQGIDHILSFGGTKYTHYIIRQKWFEWGYPDGELFERSFEVMDSLKVKPRLDIYLTLSMHAPFTPPRQDHYLQVCMERIKSLKLKGDLRSEVEKQKDIFSSILYTDDALKEFFQRNSKRPEFKNTIFIITGDHALPELNASWTSLIEKFHVPLIIYSPMLKSPASFQAVTTHLDITPSILAMLKSQFDIRIQPVCHWLGKGLDMSERFRNTRMVSFIYNDRHQAEYLNRDWFISLKRLYKLLPDMKLQPVDDGYTQLRLKKELQDYLKITGSITGKTSLIPESVYFTGNYAVKPYETEKPVIFKNSRFSDEFISLMPGHFIKEEFDFLKIDLSLNIRTTDPDTSSIPSLVVQILNEKFQNDYWGSFLLKRVEKSIDKERFEMEEYIDLSYIHSLKSKIMKVYLWNRNKREILLNSNDLKILEYKNNGKAIISHS